jgi:hypothetical protein
METTARPTTYTVSCLPEDGLGSENWSIEVQYVSAFGEHRFTLEDALERAKKAAPDVIVNGQLPAEYIARHARA